VTCWSAGEEFVAVQRAPGVSYSARARMTEKEERAGSVKAQT
jgi:hypothetical protein